jgi:prevent-host-death family protein
VATQQSITDARTNLPQLVREAAAGEAIELTRRGERVAVLIGQKEYERLAAARPRRFSEAWDAFVRELSPAGLKIDPADVFSGVRDPRPRRQTGL